MRIDYAVAGYGLSLCGGFLRNADNTLQSNEILLNLFRLGFNCITYKLHLLFVSENLGLFIEFLPDWDLNVLRLFHINISNGV
ncbi:hypothetical protein CH361_01040 [Leptospira brenneri]|nr:hypothetical protein CH361_01040 [Leptospira brenneri]